MIGIPRHLVSGRSRRELTEVPVAGSGFYN